MEQKELEQLIDDLLKLNPNVNYESRNLYIGHYHIQYKDMEISIYAKSSFSDLCEVKIDKIEIGDVNKKYYDKIEKYYKKLNKIQVLKENIDKDLRIRKINNINK